MHTQLIQLCISYRSTCDESLANVVKQYKYKNLGLCRDQLFLIKVEDVHWLSFLSVGKGVL